MERRDIYNSIKEVMKQDHPLTSLSMEVRPTILDRGKTIDGLHLFTWVYMENKVRDKHYVAVSDRSTLTVYQINDKVPDLIDSNSVIVGTYQLPRDYDYELFQRIRSEFIAHAMCKPVIEK